MVTIAIVDLETAFTATLKSRLLPIEQNKVYVWFLAFVVLLTTIFVLEL